MAIIRQEPTKCNVETHEQFQVKMEIFLNFLKSKEK